MRFLDGLAAILMDGDPGAAGGGGASAPVSAPASAPSVSAPSVSSPAPSGGGDVDSAIDNILGTGASAPSKAPTESPVAPAQQTPTEQVVPKPAVAEPVVEAPPAEPVEDTDSEDDSDLDAGMEDTSKPNFLDLKASRGKRIYGSYKAYKAITDALGHEPSVEDVRAHFEAYSDKVSMEDEFLSGDPVKAQNFVSHWNDLNPQAMEVMAAQLPELLVGKNNQNAYVAMAMPVLNRFTNALYQQAQGEQNPDLKKALMYTARMVDWKLRGEYRNDAALAAQPVAQPDPREAQVNQRYAQIQAYEQQQVQQQQRNWFNSVSTSNDSALQEATDNALKSLRAALPTRVYAATRNDFTEAVRQHLAKDVDANRLYDIQLGRTQRSDEGRGQLTNAYMQRASRAIRQLAPSLLKEAGVAAVTQNQQAHTALAAQAKAGAAPNSPGRPVTQSIAPDPRQFASKSEQLDATIDTLLGATRRG